MRGFALGKRKHDFICAIPAQLERERNVRSLYRILRLITQPVVVSWSVLYHWPRTEAGIPSFAIPNGNETERFYSDIYFRNPAFRARKKIARIMESSKLYLHSLSPLSSRSFSANFTTSALRQVSFLIGKLLQRSS